MKSLTVLAFAVSLVAAGCAGHPAAEPGDPSEAEIVASAPLFQPPEHPHPAAHPFVLVHAFNASSTDDWSFNGVVEALATDGHFAVAADLQPFQGSPVRAERLVAQMDQARRDFCRQRRPNEDQTACFERTKVNIIGHSQGGLDARWAISRLGYGPHTASLTTMSTPHRGTPIGDRALRFLGSGALDPITNAVFKIVGLTRTTPDLAKDADVRQAFFWLSEARTHDPSLEMPNVDGVFYQSWAGVTTVAGEDVDTSACEGKMIGSRGAKLEAPFDLHFLPLVPAFDREHRPNDGHIPVASAKWGTFRGCLPADHLDLVGQPALEHRPGRTFEHRAFYRVLASELADRGL